MAIVRESMNYGSHKRLKGFRFYAITRRKTPAMAKR